MPLPTNYAAGQAFGPVDINNTNAAVNALFSPGIITTALSASPLTMASTTLPVIVFTGTTQAQTVTLPPTAALGQQWLIINQGTTAVVTCNGSTSGTPVTIAGGASAVLTANTTTPTTAAGWDVQYGGISITGGKVVNFANSLTFTGTDGTTMTFPAVTGNVVAPPTVFSTATSTAAIVVNATQIQIASVQIPTSTAVVGTAFKLLGWGTVSSTVSGSLTWYVTIGSLNTTADTAVASASCLIGNQSASASHCDGMLTVRATSATTGSCMASLTCWGDATATATASVTQGLNLAANMVNGAIGQSTQTANVSYTNSAATYVSLSVKASAGTFDLQNAYVAYAGA